MHAHSPTLLYRTCRAVFLAAFAAGLLAPLVDEAVRPATARDSLPELRAPALLPAWPRDRRALQTLPKRFDAWYVDHFGLRDVFLRWHNVAKWFGLGVSPTRKILLGEGGWVFPTENMALEDHRGALPLEANALAAWRRMLEGRRDFLSEHGIQFLFVVAPYKSRVYPERIPARYAVRGPTRAEQIVAYMERTSDFRILDLRAAVMEAKAWDAPGDPAFYPYGIHWTHRGAHAAYVEIARELARRFPEIEPLPDAAFEIRPTEEAGDTWAGRLYMRDLLHQKVIQWRTREPHAVYPGDWEESSEFHSERVGANLPRAWVLHDSFGPPLRPWLAEHFSSLDSIWTQEPMIDRILAARPDVLIQVYDEQTIARITPELTRQEDRGARERRFDRSGEVLWRFDPRKFPEGLTAQGEGDLRLEDGAIVHDRRGPKDFLLLPELEYPRGADVLLRLELESAESGEILAFYRTRLQPGIRRDQCLATPLNRGRDAFVIEIPAADFAGRITLCAGEKTSSLRIRAIEVRAGHADRGRSEVAHAPHPTGG